MVKKKHCTFCGAENRMEDVLCHRCQNNLNAEDQLLKDFLIERTKDKLKGDLDDSLRELIMNFLKSHLYGMVFTISLVSVIAVNAFGSLGSIPQVTQRPDFSNTPVVNDHFANNDSVINSVEQKIKMTGERNEVKQAIDHYFETARNVHRIDDVDGAVEPLIYYEEFDIPEIGFHYVPFFDVVEFDGIESISLDYHLLDINADFISSVAGERQREKGYDVAEATLVETLTFNGETTERTFFICLTKHEEGWLVCHAVDVSNDMKSVYYYDDLLWDMLMDTLQGSKEHFLPEEHGYVSSNDVKDTMNFESQFDYTWYEDLGQTEHTELSDRFVEEGYRIAQVVLVDSLDNSEYVMTFVNAAGAWYIAEVVEK